jgi:hypothetical protein
MGFFSDLFGGSAKSKSQSVNINDETYISKNTMNEFNSSSNSAVANALIESSALCQNSNRINQEITIKGCKTKRGNINIGTDQSAAIVVDFSCLNAFTANQEMAQSLLSELTTDLQNKMDVKSKSDMKNKAEAEVKTTGILGGSASSDINGLNVRKLRVENITDRNITNVIKNSIESNFKVNSIQECVQSNEIKQKALIDDCSTDDGDININSSQKASIDVVTKCVNESGVVNKVITEATNKMGVTVVDDLSALTDTTMENDIKAIVVSTGLTGCPCPGCDDPSTACAYVIGIYCCIVLLMCVASCYFND